MNRTATAHPVGIATSGSRSTARRAATLVAATLALGIAAPAAAARRDLPVVIVLPATGRGISSMYVAQARWMFVQQLSKRPSMRVVDYDGPPTATPLLAGPAAETARNAGAVAAVTFDVSHADGRTVFDVTCYEAVTGRPACHVHEITNGGPEILPGLASWLAMRLERDLWADPPRPAAPPAPGAPPVAEARAHLVVPERARHERMLTFGVRIDATMPIASPSPEPQLLAGFGAIAALDSGYVMSSLTIDVNYGGDQRMQSIGLGVFLPIGDQSLLPLAGLSAHWVDQRLGGRGGSGLQLRPTLGILWGRHDFVKMRIEAAYFVDLFEELPPDRLSPSAGVGRTAHGLALSTGVTF